MESPTLEQIRQARRRLDPYIVDTPIWRWQNQDIQERLGTDTEVVLKLELFQHTGSFKARGALINVLGLDAAARQRGVTAVSAGNHAIAVAYAGRLLGANAKVVMPKSANPVRVTKSRNFGAEVVLVDNVEQAFAEVRRIEREEGRYFVHPFEGLTTILGTATIGLDWLTQAPDLDAVIVPIGGGGLCAGIATAVKLINPACQVFGVEPSGADTMHRSFAAGSPQSIDAVRTIADSLGAPYAAPYSLGLCMKYVDELVLVEDDEMRRAMALLFHSMKLAVEPAGAAATAKLCGPLRQRLAGQRVGVIVCGANIDVETFASYIAEFAP
ncbi:MAG: threonine/serine dehydratase [Caldilineaceae bacterium]